MKQILILVFVLIFTIGCSTKPKKIEKSIEPVEVEKLVIEINNKNLQKLKVDINRSNVNALDSSGVSLLSRAVLTKKFNVVKLLIEKGANPSLRNNTKSKSTPLMMCANYDLVKIAKFLIDKGAEINAQDSNGDAVINWSAYMAEYNFTKMLLDNNAITNQKSIHSDNTMGVALKEWQDSIVDLLISYDKGIVKVLKQNKPIIKAVKNNDLAFVKAKVNANNVNITDEASNSLLIIATIKKNKKMLALLLEKGAAINQINDVGHTALNKAVWLKYNDIANYLISKGADINKTDNRFVLPPIIAAARVNNVEMGKILLDKGANIDIANGIDRFTPIIWATAYNHVDFVKLLLQYHPDLSIKSKYNNKDVFAYANKEIKTLLKSYQSK